MMKKKTRWKVIIKILIGFINFKIFIEVKKI